MKPKHVCGDECVCPVDMKPLLYNEFRDIHACQDPECEFANGFEEGVKWPEVMIRSGQS